MEGKTIQKHFAKSIVPRNQQQWIELQRISKT